MSPLDHDPGPTPLLSRWAHNARAQEQDSRLFVIGQWLEFNTNLSRWVAPHIDNNCPAGLVQPPRHDHPSSWLEHNLCRHHQGPFPVVDFK